MAACGGGGLSCCVSGARRAGSGRCEWGRRAHRTRRGGMAAPATRRSPMTLSGGRHSASAQQGDHILMIRLSRALGAIAASAIASITIASASAEPLKLAELLGSTHVHGLAEDAGDSDRLLVATHHGPFPVGKRTRLDEQLGSAHV